MKHSAKTPPRRTPQPSAEEIALFRVAMREAKPLTRSSNPPRPGPLSKGEGERQKSELPTRNPVPTGPLPTGGGARSSARLRDAPAPAPNPGIDRRTAERLRRGEIAVEATLDLHGLTQDAAHRALDRFIARAWAERRRMLLVVTGKGSVREGGGALRRGVPLWLAAGANAPSVLRIASAQPRHGGAGAYYVLLRRRREP